jgi:hypothetical protein
MRVVVVGLNPGHLWGHIELFSDHTEILAMMDLRSYALTLKDRPAVLALA